VRFVYPHILNLREFENSNFLIEFSFFLLKHIVIIYITIESNRIELNAIDSTRNIVIAKHMETTQQNLISPAFEILVAPPIMTC
jgi:hypothetical protein